MKLALPPLACWWQQARAARALARTGSGAAVAAGASRSSLPGSRHREHCAPCRAWLQRLEEVDVVLARAFAAPPSPTRALETRVGIAVRAAIFRPDGSTPALAQERPAFRPRLAWAMAAVLALPLCGLALARLWTHYGGRPAPQRLHIELPSGIAVTGPPLITIARAVEETGAKEAAE